MEESGGKAKMRQYPVRAQPWSHAGAPVYLRLMRKAWSRGEKESNLHFEKNSLAATREQIRKEHRETKKGLMQERKAVMPVKRNRGG